ncbi:MAG: acetyl/propionyl/methylcrotonyl-CoA carboxylase subunit alpha [Alphaproteobacteria bacterium]|nr:acetyl/propionyl/methylcrotonyl-CoA carboxylase subunit alpha [Alphaproteobacteria bacterium]MBO6864690.1 acetyl/propionyl/methylcrotonyl-CoA carboxylase subunit alpha [Alphaproteobacteria bacterium]
MFKRILIANRGEIACRVIETARRLGIETVAVYSDADAKAMHVDLADYAVRLGPAPARESYLRGELILQAAKDTGAEAIHPGYGFLSENADFADACDKAGIVFIGPPADAIRAMGSKSEAKALMGKAGVPLTPGYHGADQDPAHLKAEADTIGYPVLIKASAGGGGKGMRLVERTEDFDEALASCRREASASFGDDRVLVERFVTRPRHIEMQVFADSHGNAVHLFERDCSIQRRHQKVVEEATAPGMPEELRQRMGEAAVAAAKAVGYRGAGTVEFIAETRPDGTPGDFFFMEMNTRLQVEHPVTELVTGQDLVEWQLRVAAGETLPMDQSEIFAFGHAMEVRLYAEDPDGGFLPSIGTLNRLRFPDGNDIRVDTGVREGDEVSPHYDPMIAKLIAFGDDRKEAIRKLIAALRATEAAGITTNRDFLIRVLADKDFQDGTLDTGFIAAREAALLPGRARADDSVLIAAALAVLDGEAQSARRRAVAAGDPHSPWAMATGWRLNDSGPVDLRFRDFEGERSVSARSDSGHWRCRVEGGDPVEALLLGWDSDGLRVRIGGTLMRFGLDRTGERFTLFSPSHTYVLDRVDPLAAATGADQSDHALTAPMPGKVTAVFVRKGDAVKAGTSLMILEAMKMEHTIKAPADGVIETLPYAEGDQVGDGAVLVTFEGDA